MASGGSRAQRDNNGGLTGRIDDTHVEVDWPRSIGFFGALGVAAALDLVPLPIAVFVAAVPFLKMFNRPDAPRPQRFMSHLVDGAAKPVGGDAEGTVRWVPRKPRSTSTRSRSTRSTSTRSSSTRSRSRK